MIYLDNSATTRPCEAGVAAMTEMLTTIWGNPSSLHGLGLEAGRHWLAVGAAAAGFVCLVFLKPTQGKRL